MDSTETIEAIYTNKCDKFKSNGVINYNQQYYNIYRKRLERFRPEIASRAKEMFGETVIIRKLTDLNEDEKCVIIGTIYKQQELKPNILKDIASEANVVPQPVRASKFTSADDKIILEDENLRVLLTGKISLNEFVTGVTVGVYGTVGESGSFDVSEIVYPNLLSIVESPSIPILSENRNYFVLLLSGLSFGDKIVKECPRFKILSDFLNGFFGGGLNNPVDEKLRNVCRLIIAGNSISEDLVDKNYGKMARYLVRKIDTPTLEAVQQLDTFLASIASAVKIDLMPGQHDPANKMLPQQPFHKCMLPKSLEYESVYNVTNPYSAEIGGVSFLGTSGQNIDDIYRFCDQENRLKIASWTLKWRHLAPSSPDTLDCYPFADCDPFYIEERPDVYFIGNQPEFGCHRLEDDRRRPLVILTLPNFADTGFCALINLKDLKVEPLRFGPEVTKHDDGSIVETVSNVP